MAFKFSKHKYNKEWMAYTTKEYIFRIFVEIGESAEGGEKTSTGKITKWSYNKKLNG